MKRDFAMGYTGFSRGKFFARPLPLKCQRGICRDNHGFLVKIELFIDSFLLACFLIFCNQWSLGASTGTEDNVVAPDDDTKELAPRMANNGNVINVSWYPGKNHLIVIAWARSEIPN